MVATEPRVAAVKMAEQAEGEAIPQKKRMPVTAVRVARAVPEEPEEMQVTVHWRCVLRMRTETRSSLVRGLSWSTATEVLPVTAAQGAMAAEAEMAATTMTEAACLDGRKDRFMDRAAPEVLVVAEEAWVLLPFL